MSARKQDTATKVAGVILAAGDSQRFPDAKQFLRWQGKALVWYAVRAALEADLAPVVVVTGARGDDIRETLKHEPVELIDNPDWTSGQSSSMKAGLAAVCNRAAAVVMLLADMPRVDAKLVRSLVEAYQSSEAAIVAPRVAGQRGNPVLFTRAAYADLFAVEGDRGGRGLIGSLPTKWIDWDDSILLDIDTPEDLERAERDDGRDC